MSFISETDSLSLWAVILVVVAVSIILEQRYKWASFISSCLICIALGFLLSNLKIVPYEADTYTAVSSILLPCAIPLLLFKANLKVIIKSSGKLFLIFHFAAVGSLIGVMLCWLLMHNIQNADVMLAAGAAGWVGGTVNIIAVGNVFNIDQEILSSLLVYANFACGILMIAIRIFCNSQFAKSQLAHPHIDALESIEMTEELKKQGKTATAAFWGGKEVSLKDIALALAVTFSIVGISTFIANGVTALNPPMVIAQLFGSSYMIITLITVAAATLFPKFFDSIHGAMELGNIALLAWFVTVGFSGNIVQMLQNGLLFIAMFCIVSFCNMVFAFIGSKVLKGDCESVGVASMANIGGPPGAAAVAASNGWTQLVTPAILVGLWGYVIGSYFGIIVGNIVGL
ncbi:MAG: DUF819 family protein [Lachnospiraceae bacterium]|nr:DUF819 family protein [Lachnospiraceae bacterium]